MPLFSHITGAVVLAALAATLASPAMAQRGSDSGGPGGRMEPDGRNNRVTVSIRTVPVGSLCVRAVEAVGYDPRLNQALYRIRFDSGVMSGLGVLAYENAFASARNRDDAARALGAAQADAVSFRRGPGQCL